MNPKVLMIAYACNPEGSGEHWLGWGWAEQAAKKYEVHLITTANSRFAVEQHARRCGITAHFVDLPAWLKKVTSHLGSAGSWLRKVAWQYRVGDVAATLHQQHCFALVHQTTFHTFRVPFLAARLGIPSIWGPIAGGEQVPPGFQRYLGPARLPEFGRRLANKLWLAVPPIRESLRRASIIFVSNHSTLDFLPATCRAKCLVLPPNALRQEDENFQWHPAVERNHSSLHLLYVGNCVHTRAVPLVFEALTQARVADYRFSIVGDGPALAYWRRQVKKLGLADKVDFAGKVPYQELAGYYAWADVLVFPALRDSGGSALLEAMARQVPVLCLDWGGPGEMIDGDSGIKVSVSDADTTVKTMAEALVRLKENPALGAALAQAARKRAEALFRWDAKFRLLESCYQRLITERIDESDAH